MLEPDHTRAQGNLAHYEQILSRERQTRGEEAAVGEVSVGEQKPLFPEEKDEDYSLDEDPKNWPWEVERRRYEKLCREPLPVADWRKQSFTCFYTTGRQHPQLVLRPVAVEVVYVKPTILLYRNLLSDSEMDRLKELATPKVCRLISPIFIQCWCEV